MSARETKGDWNGWKRGEYGFARSKDDSEYDGSKGSADKKAAKRQFGPTSGPDMLAQPGDVGEGRRFSNGSRY